MRYYDIPFVEAVLVLAEDDRGRVNFSHFYPYLDKPDELPVAEIQLIEDRLRRWFRNNASFVYESIKEGKALYL